MRRRPRHFTLAKRHPLRKGLVFAALGGGAPTLLCADSSGYGNHGTLTNMDPPTDWVWASELGRWAVDFDGDNSGNRIQLAIAITFANGVPWTFSCWADNDSTYENTGLYGNNYSSTKYTRLLFVSGVWRAYSDGNNYVSWASNIATGLHHVAVVCDGTSLSLYRDGVLVDGPDALAGPFTFARLGNYGTSGAADDSWDGRLSDIAIHARALSLSEIQILANRSDPMLGGLIVPSGRRVWAAAVAVPPVVTARNIVIGGGVI